MGILGLSFLNAAADKIGDAGHNQGNVFEGFLAHLSSGPRPGGL